MIVVLGWGSSSCSIINNILPFPTNIEMLSVRAELSQSTIIFNVYLPLPPTLSQIESLSHHLSQFQPPFNNYNIVR